MGFITTAEACNWFRAATKSSFAHLKIPGASRMSAQSVISRDLIALARAVRTVLARQTDCIRHDRGMKIFQVNCDTPVRAQACLHVE